MIQCFTNSEGLFRADSCIRLGVWQTLPDRAGEAKQVPAPTEKVRLPEARNKFWVWLPGMAESGNLLLQARANLEFSQLWESIQLH